MPHTLNHTDDRQLLMKAINNSRNLPAGDKFIIRDLLTDQQWESLREPKKVGRIFRRLIENEGIAIKIDRNNRNMAIYERL